MNEIDKINIVLKEYETLRTEILQRISNRFAFLSLFGAIGAYGLFKAAEISLFQAFVLFFAVIFLFAVWWQLGNVIARCSKRIAEIEKLINEISGEKLLKWESERLGSKTFHQFHS